MCCFTSPGNGAAIAKPPESSTGRRVSGCGVGAVCVCVPLAATQRPAPSLWPSLGPESAHSPTRHTPPHLATTADTALPTVGSALVPCSLGRRLSRPLRTPDRPHPPTTPRPLPRLLANRPQAATLRRAGPERRCPSGGEAAADRGARVVRAARSTARCRRDVVLAAPSRRRAMRGVRRLRRATPDDRRSHRPCFRVHGPLACAARRVLR